MVSIESRNAFMAELAADPEAKTMVTFIGGGDGGVPAARGRLANRIAIAVLKSDKNEFQNIVDELGERKLSPDAEWIKDDYLLFSLAVASRKFEAGQELTQSILQAQQVSESESKKLHSALSQFAFGSSSIDGEYSFAKLVLRELVAPADLALSDARVVYGELVSLGDTSSLPTLPRLLANRAFDIIVQKNVIRKLDSSAKIAAEIQSRAEDFSIGDWWEIAMAMKPKILWTIILTLGAIVGGAFWTGGYVSGIGRQANDPPSASDRLLPRSNSASRLAPPDSQQPKRIGTD